MGNKVNFGVKNAHYAPITVDPDTNEDVYGTPVRLPGTVELTLEPRGDMTEFFADNMLYYSAPNNQGYEGTLTIANIPQHFAVDVLGEEQDEEDEVLTEKTNAKTSRFAFMFEFDGDVKATRHVLYNCSANRPTVSGTTKTDSVEPNTTELSFVASARVKDNAVKTKTTTNTPSTIYDAWYDVVYEKVSA
ncbi:major tail protein [Gracilibacillus sp. HCP3S3_G5_1]|uniref:major tail protein n=1 Tax=unclassified Gracilibacillus TaxID=2625209 RepID=UPI003F8B5F85